MPSVGGNKMSRYTDIDGQRYFVKEIRSDLGDVVEERLIPIPATKEKVVKVFNLDGTEDEAKRKTMVESEDKDGNVTWAVKK